jgi:hypothetical protein
MSENIARNAAGQEIVLKALGLKKTFDTACQTQESWSIALYQSVSVEIHIHAFVMA